MMGAVHAAAERALDYVTDGMVVGLGTGHAAEMFVRALAVQIARGLRITAVATSDRTAALAQDLRIPIVSLAEVAAVDVTVDGADEVNRRLELIKGRGGALLREKVVAASSRRLVIVVDQSKIVTRLGERGLLPVEVVPFALPLCQRRLDQLGYRSTVRIGDSGYFLTDNGNYLLDCQVPLLNDPTSVDLTLRAIPGVVTSGLFLGLADIVLVQSESTVYTVTRSDT